MREIKIFIFVSTVLIANSIFAMDDRKLAWFNTIPDLAQRCANYRSQSLFPSPEQDACERRSWALKREALTETEERKSAKKDIQILFPEKTPEQRENIFRQYEAQRAYGIEHHEEIKLMHGLVRSFETDKKD